MDAVDELQLRVLDDDRRVPDIRIVEAELMKVRLWENFDQGSKALSQSVHVVDVGNLEIDMRDLDGDDRAAKRYVPHGRFPCHQLNLSDGCSATRIFHFLMNFSPARL